MSRTITETIPDVTPAAANGPAPDSRGARQFLTCVFFGAMGLTGLVVALNMYVDIYGLFRSTENRPLPIYHNERPSKYLLSYHYIPENFNTVLLGTSLSDNLDVSAYNTPTSRHRMYNASMMGANVTEINAVARKLVAGGVRNVIFCVSPYQMKNTGEKEVAMDSKLYWGALGSKNLYETYAVALAQKWNLAPGRFATINAYGVNAFTERYRVKDVRKQIHYVMNAQRNKPIYIDSAAVNEFKSLIKFFRAHKVNLIAYFHPVPKELYDSKAGEHAAFQQMIRTVLNDDARVLDFNTPEYTAFTSDYTHYIDNGHLSETGQAFVMRTLYEKLQASQ